MAENHIIDTEKLTRFRRYLHRYPEVSGKEYETAKKISTFLREHSPDRLIEGLGGTGIAAIYKGKEEGRTVLIRCELDALPIPEINTFDYRSERPGISHKCGHDGHMTMVAGLADLLQKQRPQRGRVVLLFQPSEEDGSGAGKVLSDPGFAEITPDYVFALHNVPSFPKGQIVIKDGVFTPAVNSIVIALEGKTAHAGEPEKGINPAYAIAEIVREFHALAHPDIHADHFCIVTPIHIRMGEIAYGVSAGEGEIHYTIRCRTNQRMKEIGETAEKIAREAAYRYGLKEHISWTQNFFANENDPRAVQWMRDIASEQGFDLFEKETSFGWGEDFGLFTRKFPGAMFGLGAGEDTPALHNPDYDFPDKIIPVGVRMFYELIKKVTSYEIDTD